MQHKIVQLVAALAVVPFGFSIATTPVFLDEGHLDVVFSFNGTAWHTEVNFEESVSYPVEQTVFVAIDAPVPDGVRFPRTAGSEWDFIGVAAGEDYWFFPSGAWGPNILEPGFDTEAPSGVNYADLIATTIISDPRAPGTGTPQTYIIIELLRHRYYGDGEGHVSMWLPGSPPTVFWSTYAEPAYGNLWYNIAGDHDHMNWGFSDRGVYKLELQARAELLDGTTTYSPVTTVTVAIGVPHWDSPYGMWRNFNFTEAQVTEGLADPEVDITGSGVTNNLAYAFGLDPFAATATELPQIVELPSGEKAHTFERNLDATSFDFLIETSTDLVNWTVVASAANGQPFTLLEPGWEITQQVMPDGRVEITTEIPRPAAGPEPAGRFLRLRLVDE